MYRREHKAFLIPKSAAKSAPYQKGRRDNVWITLQANEELLTEVLPTKSLGLSRVSKGREAQSQKADLDGKPLTKSE